jgi:hypothetical protein
MEGERWRQTLTAMARQASRQPGGVEPNPDGSVPSLAALMMDAQCGLVDRAGAVGGGAGSRSGSQQQVESNRSGGRDSQADATVVNGSAAGVDGASTSPTGHGSGGGMGSAVRTLPQASILIDGAALRSGMLRGVSELSGEPLASTVLASILCDCEARGIVTGEAGEPLDVGRAHRFVPLPIRRALAIRDGGCCFPGCDQPASNTHAHHLIPWWADGPTALENLASVCHRHHVVVEPAREARDGTLPGKEGWDDPSRWRIIIDPADGLPRAVPPERLDPDREPILHGRLQARLGDPPTRPSRPPGEHAAVDPPINPPRDTSFESAASAADRPSRSVRVPASPEALW